MRKLKNMREKINWDYGIQEILFLPGNGGKCKR